LEQQEQWLEQQLVLWLELQLVLWLEQQLVLWLELQALSLGPQVLWSQPPARKLSTPSKREPREPIQFLCSWTWNFSSLRIVKKGEFSLGNLFSP
jgi:hypothetical protein